MRAKRDKEPRPSTNGNARKTYLESSAYIDWKHPLVAVRAAELGRGCLSDEVVARRCFEFVRDCIEHSWDFRRNELTCKASEVLLHATGWCYAKSHLLAALLRANAIPAGLCYQRLTVETGGLRHCLHGLNAVYLKRYGWYRIDARGNKPGVSADFCPPVEKPAFPVTGASERDFQEIWAEPLPVVIRVLTRSHTVEEVFTNLPDVETMNCLERRSRV
ncbi:MAG: transglutaminase family protein [Syntrophobacteraceae bacterium]|nr:transglutaminase family protein [Syntrophobacteraceae bacterium]